MLTFLPLEQIAELEQQMQGGSYKPNTAQELLAREVLTFVHGEQGLQAALQATQVGLVSEYTAAKHFPSPFDNNCTGHSPGSAAGWGLDRFSRCVQRSMVLQLPLHRPYGVFHPAAAGKAQN